MTSIFTQHLASCFFSFFQLSSPSFYFKDLKMFNLMENGALGCIAIRDHCQTIRSIQRSYIPPELDPLGGERPPPCKIRGITLLETDPLGGERPPPCQIRKIIPHGSDLLGGKRPL